MDTKALCLALANCETEVEVINLLKIEGLWENDKNWQYFGGVENNYSTIGNQQSEPENAIVEKIINSVDSMLTSECLKRGIAPDTRLAPANIQDALVNFFNIPEGKLTNITSTQRSKLAENIHLIATGAKGNPSYTLIDKGEGQSPSNFKNTILSLGKSNKLRIPFVQGKFNMGGTGVFRFCGKSTSSNVSLIISKRNPEIAKTENDPLKERWGFTVVRRDSAIEGARSSSYKYLTFEDGEIISFKSDSLPLLPGKYPTPYEAPLEWGCFFKFYEYQIGPFKSPIILDLNYKLSLLMPNIALPVKLYERRKDYSANSYEAVLSGLSVRIDEDRSNNIEEGFPATGNLMAQGQKMKYSIYVFKPEKYKNYTKNEGVIFTINGQTHGALSKMFYNRKSVGLGYLSDSILINLDCTDFDSRAREVLFMNSRDRLCKDALKTDIESELEELLKNHKGLKLLKETRRKEEIESKLKDEQPLADILKNILKSSPILSKLFISGERLQNPFDNRKTKMEELYKGKVFPTFFDLTKNYPLTSPKEAHKKSRFRIQFRTDANNDFFNRDKDCGTIELRLNGYEVSDFSINLWNGYATLSISTENMKIGDTLFFETEIHDISRVGPFSAEFYVKVFSEIESDKNNPPGKRKPPFNNDEDSNNESTHGLSLPDIIDVGKDDWSSYDFDQYSALKIKGDQESGYIFYVNIDNFFLQSELKDSKSDFKLVQAKYKFGLVLIALALINEESKSEADAENEDRNIFDEIAKITKGLSSVIIPIIDSLSKIEIEELQLIEEEI